MRLRSATVRLGKASFELVSAFHSAAFSTMKPRTSGGSDEKVSFSSVPE